MTGNREPSYPTEEEIAGMAICEQVERNKAERTKFRYMLAGLALILLAISGIVYLICWSYRAAYDNGYVQEVIQKPTTTETKTETFTVWVKRSPTGVIQDVDPKKHGDDLRASDFRKLVAEQEAKRNSELFVNTAASEAPAVPPSTITKIEVKPEKPVEAKPDAKAKIKPPETPAPAPPPPETAKKPDQLKTP